jgi:hypothetical protein
MPYDARSIAEFLLVRFSQALDFLLRSFDKLICGWGNGKFQLHLPIRIFIDAGGITGENRLPFPLRMNSDGCNPLIFVLYYSGCIHAGYAF